MGRVQNGIFKNDAEHVTFAETNFFHGEYIVSQNADLYAPALCITIYIILPTYPHLVQMFFRDVLSGEHGECFFDNSVFFTGIVRGAAPPRPPRPAAPARRLIRFRKLLGAQSNFCFSGSYGEPRARARGRARPPLDTIPQIVRKKNQNENERRDAAATLPQGPSAPAGRAGGRAGGHNARRAAGFRDAKDPLAECWYRTPDTHKL